MTLLSIAPPPAKEPVGTAFQVQEKFGPAPQRDERAFPRPALGPQPIKKRASPSARPAPELFHGSLLELSSTRPGQRALELFVSVAVHASLLTVLLLLPLYFTDAIDLTQFTQTLLVAPPPPPPPPPAAQAITKMRPRRVFTNAGRLIAPNVIPARVAMIKEEPLPLDLDVGVVGGVPGGVPGGQAGGVIGSIISNSRRTLIPAIPAVPAPQRPRAPMRVGGRVKAPRPIFTPQPIYPVLAKTARIEGDVVIDAVIDTSGNVVELKVVSGHPFLIPSALEAARKWKYEPTYLNEEPVPVQFLLTVRFRFDE
jgi:protein TonB